MTDVNTRVVLQERPVGLPTPDHFRVHTEAVGDLAAGHVRVATEALGVDAFIATTLTEEGFHDRTGMTPRWRRRPATSAPSA